MWPPWVRTGVLRDRKGGGDEGRPISKRAKWLTAAAALLSLPKASSTQLGRAEAVYEAAGPGVLKLRVGLANEARLDDGTGAVLRGVAGAAAAADAGARAANMLLLPPRCCCCCCCGFFLLLACFLRAGAG